MTSALGVTALEALSNTSFLDLTAVAVELTWNSVLVLVGSVIIVGATWTS